MNSAVGRSIALLIAAVVLLAIGAFAMTGDHMKTGIGLIVIGAIVAVLSLVSFFMARSAAARG